MNFSFFPQRIRVALSKTDVSALSELRFRTGFPIFGLYNGTKKYLSEQGAVLNANNAFKCGQEDVSEIINGITERSLYAFNDRLKQGYITTKDGIRVGVAGECVFDDGKIITVKKITSLNVRIPHEIKDCSSKIYDKLFIENVLSVLIVSPPAKGKTTILKDLARKLNERTAYSLLIIDERGEFESVSGENIDSVKYADKPYAMNYAVRSMSPQIIITDELQTYEDWKCAEYAATCGVKIIASCHGKNARDLLNKEYFNKNVFERYVFLDENKTAGNVKGVFDKDFNSI